MDKLKALEVKQAKPKEKPYRMYDGLGLFLEIRPNNSKYWRMKYRYADKEKLLAIGVYPTITLKEAREARLQAKKLLSKGIDPSAKKQADKRAIKEAGANTFDALADEWYLTKMLDKSASHQKRTKSLITTHLLPAFGKIPIKDITSPLLLNALRKIEAKGHIETAHKTKQTAGQIFRFAVATGRADRDPSIDLKGALKAVKVKHHAAIIEPEAVGKLLIALDNYQGSPAVMAALKLSPLFFCRAGELRHMEWEEIDWNKKQWELPAEKMKMREPHIVPLCKQAIKTLQHLQAITGRGKYVFPNPRSGSRPMSENAVRTALRTLGYTNEEMTPHGFRATARTLLDEELGYPFELIEHQLAHAVRDATGRAYNRTQHLKQRHEMMQGWADYLGRLKAQAIGIRLISNDY